MSASRSVSHRRFVLALALTSILAAWTAAAEEPAEEIFSGPQVGEKLAGFKVRTLLGDDAGKEFDPVAQAAGGPIALIFVHEVTRPSVGLMRLVMEYAAKRQNDGLSAGVVFLSDDATDAENFVKRAAHAMPKGVPITLSLDGQEGPGAYGLNRKVALTVLVAKGNRVTANFALVQPSVAADAPKIAGAVVDVLGGGKVPTLEQLGAKGYAAETRPAPAAQKQDPNLRSLLVPLIAKNADRQAVDAAAKKIEAYAGEHPAARRQIGDIARRIIEAGKLENYGTPAAQEYLKKWAKQFTPSERK